MIEYSGYMRFVSRDRDYEMSHYQTIQANYIERMIYEQYNTAKKTLSREDRGTQSETQSIEEPTN